MDQLLPQEPWRVLRQWWPGAFPVQVRSQVQARSQVQQY
jgi:hypothetical protein